MGSIEEGSGRRAERRKEEEEKNGIGLTIVRIPFQKHMDYNFTCTGG